MCHHPLHLIVIKVFSNNHHPPPPPPTKNISMGSAILTLFFKKVIFGTIPWIWRVCCGLNSSLSLNFTNFHKLSLKTRLNLYKIIQNPHTNRSDINRPSNFFHKEKDKDKDNMAATGSRKARHPALGLCSFTISVYFSPYCSWILINENINTIKTEIVLKKPYVIGYFPLREWRGALNEDVWHRKYKPSQFCFQ